MGEQTATTRNNPLAVRLPAGDRDWLNAYRAEHGYSVNSLIVVAVQQYRRRVEAAERRRSAN